MMELSLEQKRFIKSRKNGYKLLKGSSRSGKTTAVLNRIPALIQDYSTEKSDKVLVVALNDDHLREISSSYENILKDKYLQGSFFDKKNFNKLNMNTIDSLILYYFEKYKKYHKFNSTIGRDSEVYDCILKAVNSVREALERNTKVSNEILNINNTEFIKKEIKFIKESNISSLDEYQNVVRNKNDIQIFLKINLRRNCKAREVIYNVYKQYNKNLKELNIIDKDDIKLFALKEAKRKTNKVYTHIIIDEMQEFAKVELDLLKELYNEKDNSSMIFVVNADKLENSRGWINKKRNFKTLGYSMVGRCTNFKSNYTCEDSIISLSEELKARKEAENKVAAEVLENSYSQNSYSQNNNNETNKYIDLNRKVCHEFFVDSDNAEEVYTGDDNFITKSENLVEVPVFNEIAAGSPILMNDSVESKCYLPKEWVRASKDVFILKIKGDSMVNKNINDGDHVVINKQKYPQAKDIVAVEIEGEATLKTFSIKGNEVILSPENDAYEPIILNGDKEFSILGVAVGLIKGTI